VRLLAVILYSLLGIGLTIYAGKTTYYPNMGYALVMLRPFHALLIVAIWVYLFYAYIRYYYE
jgi:hypothetical protein